MLRVSAMKPQEWLGKAVYYFISVISFIVFAFLDLVDTFLCVFYSFFDRWKGESNFPCYCERKGGCGSEGDGELDSISETLYRRKNIFRDMGFLDFRKEKVGSMKKDGLAMKNRWSDCNCKSCLSWQKNSGDNQKLHVVVQEPLQETNGDGNENPAENVIFLHGFISSSSLWTETVFPNLSETGKHKFKLFAVDLLGFGRSPKPSDCLYTMNNHLDMVERSVIEEFQLNSFHIVAHSMGCIIALALAAKYPSCIKSITLIAAPYVPSSSKEKASLTALNKLAERRLWPPLLFGSSVMSWYEHLGRTICFIICRNHRTWEWILQLLTRKRELHFMLMDLTKHTHHSAFHTMHNVICGGARLMDGFFKVVKKSGMALTVIQGDKDQVVPMECVQNVKLKVPFAKTNIIANADHVTVILGREKMFTRDLEQIWLSFSENHS